MEFQACRKWRGSLMIKKSCKIYILSWEIPEKSIFPMVLRKMNFGRGWIRCSWNEQAQKNHYLMEQMADFIKQLYEYYYLKKNEIKKLQKNISPELLSSFGQQLTKTEDIKVELHRAVLNWFNLSKEGDAWQEENTNLYTFFRDGLSVIIQCG